MPIIKSAAVLHFGSELKKLSPCDDRDAEAIAEGLLTRWLALDEGIAAFDAEFAVEDAFVAIKSEEQLLRVRDRTVSERTSLMNQLRAVPLERGVVVPQGRANLRLRVIELLQRGAGN